MNQTEQPIVWHDVEAIENMARFDFQMEPVDVWVRLFYRRRLKSAWVFVTRA